MKLQKFLLLVSLFLLASCTGRTNKTNTLAPDNQTDLPSATPTSTILPNPTNTAEPTDSHIPSKNPHPTKTLINPVVPIDTSAPVISSIKDFPYNLSWVQNGSLVFWDVQNKEISYLAGIQPDAIIKLDYPVAYAERLDENRYLVALDLASDNSEVKDYALGMVDLSESSYRSIIEIKTEEKSAPLFQVSPDKEWIAFYTIFSSITYQTDPESQSHLYVILAYNLLTNETFELGTCVKQTWVWSSWCEQPLVWNQETNWLAWHGDGGLWIGEPGTQDEFSYNRDNKELLIPDLYESNGTHITHSPFEWSPDGRFLLADRYMWEGSQTIIIDTITGNYQNIPDAFEIYGTSSGVYWLVDGRLIVLYSPDSENAEISLYQPTGRENILVFQGSNQLRIGNEPTWLVPYEANQTSNAELLLLILVYNVEKTGTFLYQIDLRNLDITNIIELVSVSSTGWLYNFSWSHENGWIIFITYDDQTFLTTIDGIVVYEITDVISSESCCIQWIIP